MSGEPLFDAFGRCIHWRQRAVQGRFQCFDCEADCGEVTGVVTSFHSPIDPKFIPMTDIEAIAFGRIDGGPNEPEVN